MWSIVQAGFPAKTACSPAWQVGQRVHVIHTDRLFVLQPPYPSIHDDSSVVGYPSVRSSFPDGLDPKYRFPSLRSTAWLCALLFGVSFLGVSSGILRTVKIYITFTHMECDQVIRHKVKEMNLPPHQELCHGRLHGIRWPLPRTTGQPMTVSSLLSC